ncbi:MAG: ComEC/Rec2 family competence protein [[Clostridium] aminophilum]|nr:ComEC/Rec2 family competence protein [[Clostridium] aminophilum]MDD6196496.1 ComEC/Rec2 family competence protein [[Clostridium] aminophilum]
MGHDNDRKHRREASDVKDWRGNRKRGTERRFERGSDKRSDKKTDKSTPDGSGGIRAVVLVLMFLSGFFCMNCAGKKEPLELRLEKSENIRGAEAEGVIDSVSEKKDQIRYTVRGAVIRIPAKDRETSTFRAEKIYVTLNAGNGRDGRKTPWDRPKNDREGKTEEPDGQRRDMETSGQDGSSDRAEYAAEPGETVRFHGKLSLFDESTNPGQFDFKRYYRGLGIRYRLQADSAERLDAENESSPAERIAYRIKRRAECAIDAACLPEDRGFFRAILLGDRGMLSEEDANLFREGGISHILAVSGLHVSLIGMTIYTVLRRMGAGYGAAGAAAGILLLIYGTIAGFGASVFRAVFMTCLGMGANFIGRTYDRMSAMALALLLLLVQSPFLLYSAGVQLSFGAILAISVLADRDRRRKRAEMLEEKNRNRDRERERHRSGEKRNAAGAFGCFPGKGTGSGTEEEKGSCGAETGQYADRIREVFRMNAAIQLFTLPVILRNYFTYPAVGLLLNLVVIPLMAFAAASGFFGAGICALGIPVFAGAGISAKGIAALTGAVMAPGHYIYHFYRLLCGIARMVTFLQITPGSPSDLTVCGYYVLIFAAFYGDEISNKAVLVCKWGFIDRKKKTEKPVCTFFISIALCMMFIRRPLSGLEATFLDVRQGECLVLRYGDHAWISDCGSTQDKNVGENRLVPFLKSKGVTRVDAAFVSHPDADHMNGITYLLEEDTGISVGKLVLPTAAVCSERYDSLKENAEKAEVPVEYMEAGAGFAEGDVRLQCIHPLAGEKLDAADPNEHCLAFEVSCENLKMVLTADLPGEHEKEIEGRLTAKANRDAGSIAGGGKTEPVIILKAGHHGSATSTSEELLNAVKPDLVVISCGRHNRYGHPASEAMERIRKSGAKILDTEYDGAITVRSDGEKVRAETFCAQKSRDSGSRDKEGEDERRGKEGMARPDRRRGMTEN